MTSVGRAVITGMPTPDMLRAVGATDAGLQREVNEDRFHCDAERGVFAVIDGVGGQAAGGKAADVAVALLRERLARDTGTIADRIRDGITAANNEIHRLAATRAEWNGMACVLTIAIVRNGKVTFGHVGDTRLYKLRADQIEKLTRDHSPVGEREDASEITERDAMRHPRRNEVYRDVGSDIHDRRDRDFIDVDDVPFEPDAALLLCSDGLTDLVDSVTIAGIVRQWAGDPDSVVRELIAAANAAGGKDNVTAVYVEGEKFAASQYGRTSIQSHSAAGPARVEGKDPGSVTNSRLVRWAMLALALGMVAAFTLRTFGWTFADVRDLVGPLPFQSTPIQRTVAAGESIAEVLRDAPPGSEVIVEPGVYREQITLRPGVRLISRVPRGATIRLPAAATDVADVAAIIARNASGASIVGFNVSGDSASPLPVGILVQDSSISIVDVAITGATRAAIELTGEGTSALLASDIRDNSGSALVVRDGHAPYVSHNTFARNGRSDRAVAPIMIDPIMIGGAAPVFTSNWFVGMGPGSFVTLNSAAQAALMRDNWFGSR